MLGTRIGRPRVGVDEVSTLPCGGIYRHRSNIILHIRERACHIWNEPAALKGHCRFLLAKGITCPSCAYLCWKRPSMLLLETGVELQRIYSCLVVKCGLGAILVQHRASCCEQEGCPT